MTEVLIARPAPDPIDFKTALRNVFVQYGSVMAATMALMVDQDQHSFLVGVIFEPDQEDESIIEQAGSAAVIFLPDGYDLNFIIVNPEEPTALMDALLRNGEMFYESDE